MSLKLRKNRVTMKIKLTLKSKINLNLEENNKTRYKLKQGRVNSGNKPKMIKITINNRKIRRVVNKLFTIITKQGQQDQPHSFKKKKTNKNINLKEEVRSQIQFRRVTKVS